LTPKIFKGLLLALIANTRLTKVKNVVNDKRSSLFCRSEEKSLITLSTGHRQLRELQHGGTNTTPRLQSFVRPFGQQLQRRLQQDLRQVTGELTAT